MDVTKEIQKPRTHRGKRNLEKRAPKLIENVKNAVFVRGGHTNEIISTCLKDLNTTAAFGIKPCLVFSGDGFQQDSDLKRLKNLLTDFFRGEHPDKIRLQGLEMLIAFSAIDKKVFMKTYRILMKKSGTRIPRIELSETGPSMEWTLRRHKLASDDLFKLASKQPKAVQVKKVKNVSRDVFGTQFGRVHVKQQSLQTLQTRKMKGLKNPEKLIRRDAAPEDDQEESASKKFRSS